MKHFDIVFAEATDGLLFGQAAAPVLQGSIHGGADLVVVRQLAAASEEASSQQPASLDGYRCQLRLASQRVANSKNIIHRGALIFGMNDFAAAGLE